MLGFATKRKWIYEQKVTGPWQRLRRGTFGLLHLILFVTPWIMVRGNPALLIDLPNRRLYAFGAIFTTCSSIALNLRYKPSITPIWTRIAIADTTTAPVIT